MEASIHRLNEKHWVKQTLRYLTALLFQIPLYLLLLSRMRLGKLLAGALILILAWLVQISWNSLIKNWKKMLLMGIPSFFLVFFTASLVTRNTLFFWGVHTALNPGLKGEVAVITRILAAASLPGLAADGAALQRFCWRKYVSPANRKLWIWLGSLMAAVLLWISQAYQPVYIDIDNYILSMVLDGLFSSDNYVLFCSPVLSWMVNLFSWIFPQGDGFRILVLFSMIIAFWLLFGLFAERSSLLEDFGFFLFMLGFVFISNLLYANFTIEAGMLSAAGFAGIICCMQIKKVRPWILAASAYCLLAGYSLRPSALMLVVPYFVLSVCYLFFLKKRMARNWQTVSISLMTVLVSVMVPYICGKFVFSSPEWRQASIYNEARSEFVDYPRAESFQSVVQPDHAAPLTEAAYEGLKSMILLDTDRFDAEYLQALTENLPVERSAFSWESFSFPFSSPTGVYLKLSILGIGLMMICRSQNPILTLILILCMITGSFLISFYFWYIQRMPERVAVVLLTGCLLCLWTAAMSQKKARKGISFWKMAEFIFLGGLCLNNLPFYPLEQPRQISDIFTARQDKEPPFHPFDDGFYIWSVHYMNVFRKEEFMEKGKLPPDWFMKSNIADGDWYYEQPYYRDYLRHLNINNPLEILAEGKAKYVADEERAALVYSLILEAGYTDVKLEYLGVIPDSPFHYWQFTKGSQ